MNLFFTALLSALVLLATFSISCSLPFYYTKDNGVHGMRFSANDQFMVMAFNSLPKYEIRFFPYEQSSTCTLAYPSDKFYVYSLAVVSESSTSNSSELFNFIQVGEDMEDQNVIFAIVTCHKITCGM